MTGEIEAAGDAVTGGLLARAVEREGGAGPSAHGICRNCATALEGAYCHACGQPAHIHRSLAAIWHDLAHGVLHFEGKIWRTLPMLVWRPGELTRRFIAGERARFVSPLALFLFSVFLMFAVFSALGAQLGTGEADVGARAKTAVGTELDPARAGLAAIERERERRAAAGGDTRAIDAALVERRSDIRQLEQVTLQLGNERLTLRGSTGWKRLDKGIAKATANPNLLIYKLQTNAYKFSWALIPLSTPFVWLLFFWRRDLHLYDHAIFVTYSLAFMSLFAIGLTLLSQIGLPDDAIGVASATIPPVHLFRHLRGAYRLSRPSALVRLLILLVFASVALTLFVLLLLGLGLLG